MSLSAIVLTKNVEKHIESCLKSLDPVCEEMVILDSHSQDATPRLCARYPKVRFYPYTWTDFASARNKAMSKCKHPFVLSIDADEYLSVELQREIQVLDLTQERAYILRRANNYCGQWLFYGGVYPEKRLRLFPKAAVHWEGIVHEVPRLIKKVPLKELEATLYHNNIYNLEEHWDKIHRYSDLGAQQIIRKQKRFLFLRAFLHPVWSFVRGYILKRGFLDGMAGLVFSVLSSVYVFLKYIKAYNWKKQKPLRFSISNIINNNRLKPGP